MALLQDALNELDAITLDAVIEMQLEDSISLVGSAKGKQREGTINDAEVAFHMYTEHLRACQSILEDRKMARSMALAVHRDGELISSAHQQEDQVTRDRQVALDLARVSGDEIDDPSATHAPIPCTDREEEDAWSCKEMLDKAAALYNDDPYSQDLMELVTAASGVECEDDTLSTIQPESSAWAASRKGRARQKLSQCVACGENKNFFDVARVPCDHEYCRECLANLFQASMRDESLFPPRCDGQAIPLSQVRFFLPSELAKEFEERSVELGSKDRVYCHDPRCSTFIPKPTSVIERMEGDWLACPRCEKTTCTICKAAAHTGDCPDDTSLQQLVETAGNEQWQRCFQCHRFLELEQGCNHMTCPCGAQFCYICGLRWKTCYCEQWDEPRLYARATQIARRDPNPQRRLFQPTHSMREQPQTLRSSAVPTVTNALRRRRNRSPSPASISLWESDFSDHSEWEQDWPEDRAQGVAPSACQASPPCKLSSTEAVSALQLLASTVSDNARANDTRTRPSGLRVNDINPNIAAIVDRLRANHECAHKEWRWIRGSHRCEECLHRLPSYIFECRQCMLQACNRCRRNRL